MSVNIELLEECFEASRKNPKFDVTETNHCIIGSHPAMLAAKDNTQEMSVKLGLNKKSIFWYLDSVGWRDIKHDVEACISRVKQIIEKEHGSQPWKS